MIRTMHQFGLHLQEVEEMKPYFEIAAAPYPEKVDNENIIIAELDNRKFKGLSLVKYSKRNMGKYLYRELAGPRATSIVPTLHFYFTSGEDALKVSFDKFIAKLERCLDNNKTIYEKKFDVQSLKDGVRDTLLEFVRMNFSESKNYLFTLQIDEKWLGDIPDIKAILENTSYDKYFRDGKGDLFLGKDKTCSVTYEKNVPEVWGRVNTLGFTVNDISFSRNGFEAKDSYKMFPVSPDAVKVLEGTMRALDKKLSVNFAGLKFFVLPHFVTLGDDLVRKKNIVRRFVDKIAKVEEAGFDSLLNSIFNTEQIFHSIINDPELGKNSVYYDLFFYEEKQAQFAIKLHVSDVLPSRFRSIRDAKTQITNFYRPITYKQFKNNESFYFSPSFYNIREYFSIKREKETLIEPYFFKIVEAVFYKNRVDEEQVLRAFMSKIVPAFKNMSSTPYAFAEHVKHSFCIHQFFQTLQLFDNMEQVINAELSLTANEFVKQHDRFFDHHLKKAAFYLGCATEKLLNHQDRKYGNKPFTKNLLSLYIDFKGLGEIFNKLRKKADEYVNDSIPFFPYASFNKIMAVFGEEIGQGDSDDVTKTEISFAFSLGLTMEKEFRYRRGQNRTDETVNNSTIQP